MLNAQLEEIVVIFQVIGSHAVSISHLHRPLTLPVLWS